MDWFKIGKGVVKAAYYHSAYLTYMQCTSGKMPGWMDHKLESRLLGEISINSDMQMIPSLRQKAKRNLSFLMKLKEESVKSWLKTQHSEN